MRRRPVMAWGSVGRGTHPDKSGCSTGRVLSSEITVRECRFSSPESETCGMCIRSMGGSRPPARRAFRAVGFTSRRPTARRGLRPGGLVEPTARRDGWAIIAGQRGYAKVSHRCWHRGKYATMTHNKLFGTDSMIHQLLKGFLKGFRKLVSVGVRALG